MSIATITADTLAKLSAEEISALSKLLRSKQPLSVKVNDKGTVSVYGLQRFPVSLYPEQWTRLFKAEKAILEACAKAPKSAKVNGA